MEREKSTGYLDVIRMIACILVVGTHVSGMNLSDLPVMDLNFQVMNAYDCISIIGVPLFVMVSGSLMLSPGYECSLKKLYFEKIGKLLGIYFGCLFFYNVIRSLGNEITWNLETIKDEIILESLFGRGIYHLWFLPMIAMLYAMTPFIKNFVQDKKLCILYLGIYFVIAILLPTSFQYEYPYKSILYHIDLQFPSLIFTGYIGYYILGYFLHEHMRKLKKPEMVFVLLLGTVSMMLEIILCNLDSVKKGTFSTIVNNPLMVFDFICAGCVFLLVSQIDISRKKWLKWVSSLTLGIYLLHPFMIKLSQYFGMNTLFAPSVISIPLMTGWITLLSAIPVMAWKGIMGFLKKKRHFERKKTCSS